MTAPKVHLVKLFVGLRTFGELAAFQRAREGVVNGQTGQVELAHITRHTPKRAGDLLAGGSIFWVMSGAIRARQTLRAFRSIETPGGTRCAIILQPPLVAVSPQPRRAFQGWRYLMPQDAPPDIAVPDLANELPPSLLIELARLGLG